MSSKKTPNPSQSTTHVCCYCGKTLPESQLHFIEEEYWLCDHCMREYTTTCSHCGEPDCLTTTSLFTALQFGLDPLEPLLLAKAVKYPAVIPLLGQTLKIKLAPIFRRRVGVVTLQAV